MMTDPFITQLPQKLAGDPEIAPYFNFLNKVLHDLTVPIGDSIDSPALGSGSAVSGTGIDVAAVTGTDVALLSDHDALVVVVRGLSADVASIKVSVDAILTQLEGDGTIES